jgi:putative flippase GtrA
MIGGDAIGFHFALLGTLSFAACVIAGYLLHSRFTFKVAPKAKDLIRYTSAMTLNYPLSIASLWLLHELLDLQMPLAAPASTALLTTYNFFCSRWAISGSAVRSIQERVRS